MEKIRFAIAIPTYNRLERLKKTIDSILAQKIGKNVELYIVISNSASTDGTKEFLDSLKKKNFFIHNKRYNFKKNENSQFFNFENLAKTIPNNVDWVWWIGDDDLFMSTNSINYIAQKIIKYSKEDISFIHACQARRSNNKSQDYKDSLFNLCNKFGYHELLGWLSSLILTKDLMKYVLNECSKNKLRVLTNSKSKNEKLPSAFSHSAAIFKKCCKKKALLIDHPNLIDPQDSVQTEDSKKRWANESVGYRYSIVIDDFLEFQELGLIRKCSSNFFRYLHYKYWDHLASMYIGELLEIGKNTDIKKTQITQAFINQVEERWTKLSKLGQFIENSYDMKQLSHVFQAGLNYSMLYINSGFNHEIGNLLLAKLKTLISIPTHSFKLTISDPVSLIMNYDRKNVNSKKPIKTFPENNSNHPNNFL
tara:strand:+ start:1127 stop:2392 length:1266 start_codon:yes stop_codon:yes gene_type:complete